MATVTASGISRLMDGDDLRAHALEVMRCAGRAEYEAGVWRQLSAPDLADKQNAAYVLMDLRQRSGQPDAQVLRPLFLEPQVNLAGKGSLRISVNGFRVGSWDLDDARTHALTCLDMAEAMRCLTTYQKYLVEEVELEMHEARTTAYAVDGLCEVRRVVQSDSGAPTG
ncbi:MAG TPA: hypothetical protein VIM84_04065 [Gemmatimonadales bacterium]